MDELVELEFDTTDGVRREAAASAVLTMAMERVSKFPFFRAISAQQGDGTSGRIQAGQWKLDLSQSLEIFFTTRSGGSLGRNCRNGDGFLVRPERCGHVSDSDLLACSSAAKDFRRSAVASGHSDKPTMNGSGCDAGLEFLALLQSLIPLPHGGHGRVC